MLSGGDPSEGSICTREYIRWLPDEPSEPTSTVVVTSPQNRYVDIRVLLSGKDRKNQLNSGEGEFLPRRQAKEALTISPQWRLDLSD